MKMEPCVSKPRMKMESPVAVLPFSPNKNVTPGVLRNACESVVAPCCLSTSLLTTAMVCGVSRRSCVNLGEDTRSTFGVSSGSGAATDTFGRVLGSSRYRPGSCGGCGEREAHGNGNSTTAKALETQEGQMRHGYLPNAVC